MNEHLRLLGLRVQDRVTGFGGVCSSIFFDLYGCVQALVTPGLDKDGKFRDSVWFDTKRLVVLNQEPVMMVPSFEQVPGGQELPQFSSKPIP